MIANREQSNAAVYWPAVVFVAIFFVVSEEIRLIMTVASILLLIIKYRGDFKLSLPPYSALVILIPLIGMVSGTVNGQFDSFGSYKFIRDVAYYFSPFLLWFLGCSMGARQRNVNSFWTTLFFMSFSSSLSMIVQGLLNGGASTFTLSSFNANEMVIYAPILMILSPDSWTWRGSHKRAAWCITGVSMFAIIISLSRTSLICLLVFLLVFSLRSLPRFLKTIMLGLACVLVILAATSFFPSDVSNEFFTKIGNSITEVSSSKTLWDEVSINTNWRGYEKYCAQLDYRFSDTHTKLFGHGFGYLMSVGLYSSLVTGDVGLPFLHNGYYSLLVKCGSISVLLLLVFYGLHAFILTKMWIVSGDEVTGIALGMLLCLAICSYVIEGLFIPSALYFFTLPLAMIYGAQLSARRTD